MPEKYLTEVATTAARRAVRTYRDGALAGFAILVIGIVLSFIALNADRTERRAELKHQQIVQIDAIRSAAVLNCNTTFRAVEGTRAVLDTSSALIKRQPNITPEQVAQAQVFYAVLKQKLVLPDCRQVSNLITYNPKEPVRPVTPFHP